MPAPAMARAQYAGNQKTAIFSLKVTLLAAARSKAASTDRGHFTSPIRILLATRGFLRS
jgi:hypothetical protein